MTCSGVRMSLCFSLSLCSCVVVVRDVHLLLAHQLPVVAVGRAVEHVELVRGAHAVGGGAGVVVGDVGRPPHSALAGVVQPRGARLLDLVEGLVHQQDAAGQPRRRHHLLLEVEDAVVERLLGLALLAVDDVELVLEDDLGVAAAAGGRRLRDLARGDVAAVARQVVPDQLDAALGNREGHAHQGAGDAVTALHQLGRGGDCAWWRRRSAAGMEALRRVG